MIRRRKRKRKEKEDNEKQQQQQGLFLIGADSSKMPPEVVAGLRKTCGHADAPRPKQMPPPGKVPTAQEARITSL